MPSSHLQSRAIVRARFMGRLAAAVVTLTWAAGAAEAGMPPVSMRPPAECAAPDPRSHTVEDARSAEHHADAAALEELLFGGHASSLRWDRVPELVVIRSVMTYEAGQTDYRATREELTDEETAALVRDLTDALSVLTGRTLTAFSGVRVETHAPDTRIATIRPGQIVVGRYEGVRQQLGTLGVGGRMTRGTVIRAGSIVLDADFDRTNAGRRLLRMHELGHTLGYNHVHSRASVMNPRIGSEPTDFDRTAARIAFQGFTGPASGCVAATG